MQKLSQLPDAKLHQSTLKHAGRLRHCQADLLEFLAENLQRKLYLKHACSNLTRYIELELKIPNGTAYRYALAAQNVLEFPESASALREGRLSLEGMVESRRLFRERERLARKPSEPQPIQTQAFEENPPAPIHKRERRKILQSLENKSSSEIHRQLAEHRPANAPVKPRVKPVRGGRTEITLLLSDDEMQLLERLREVMGQTKDFKTVVLKAVDDSLEKRDPARREERRAKRAVRKAGPSKGDESQSELELQNEVKVLTAKSSDGRKRQSKASKEPTESKSPKLQNEAKAAKGSKIERVPVYQKQGDPIFKEAGYQCEHRSADGRRCSARSHLDIDHILPVSKGGTNERANLRVLCAAHNRNRGYWDKEVHRPRKT